MQFLLRPQLNEEESLTGYIERIVYQNQYQTSLGIYNLLTSSTRDLQNNIFEKEDTVILGRLTNETMDRLYSRSYSKWNKNQESGKKYILRNKVKFCSECLNLKGIHQYIWGFHPVCMCVEHQQILIDHCPKCHKNFTLHEILQLGSCKRCGYQLLTPNENRYKPTPFYMSSQALIQRCFLEDDPVLNDIGIIEVEQFFRLAELSFHILEGLQSFIDNQPIPIHTFSNKRNGNLDNLKHLVSWGNFIWMYQDFPTHYYQVLNEFSKKNKGTMYEQKVRYEQGLIAKEFSWIRNAYEQFWIQKLNEGAIRKDFSIFKNNKDLLRQRVSLRREEVKNETGMCYGKIKHLQQIGRLEMKSNPFGVHQRYIVNQTSLNKLIEERDSYIHKHDAASILGITRESVAHLINEEILKEVVTPYVTHKMILKRDIEELLLDCSGPYQRSFRGISFHEALIKYSVNGLKIIDLIRFTRAGLIHPRRRCFSGTLADALYSEYELEKCIAKLKNERQEVKGYYLSEVMKIMHIGEKKLKLLLQDKGIIPDQTVVFKDGRKRYLFTQEKIEEIRKALD
ncbi:TniQ family protein [Paenibacillus sp. BR2-3]|uniref:TniQ family protein n=1 Tax=Paenibacillus sp. BR2-3 TaxID=3048494 RepID=UPI003977CA79